VPRRLALVRRGSMITNRPLSLVERAARLLRAAARQRSARKDITGALASRSATKDALRPGGPAAGASSSCSKARRARSAGAAAGALRPAKECFGPGNQDSIDPGAARAAAADWNPADLSLGAVALTLHVLQSEEVGCHHPKS